MKQKQKHKNSEFSKLYYCYYHYIFSLINIKIQDYDTSCDLTQEVFMRLFSKLDTVTSIKPWLISVQKNVLFEFYRKNKKPNQAATTFETGFDSESLFHSDFHEVKMIVDDAIKNTCNHNDKAILELVACQKFSYAEAGNHIGLNKNQVRYRYNRITRKILCYFKKKGINSIKDIL
ncbi:MAG: sigma-70 family RNA polymerase sigma factor [bacterium]|nr:sigma-70 family RNA polymerase sigma factor [bacterium]